MQVDVASLELDIAKSEQTLVDLNEMEEGGEVKEALSGIARVLL